MRVLTDEQKQGIIEDLKNGMSKSKVAKKYNVNASTVYRIMKEAETTPQSSSNDQKEVVKQDEALVTATPAGKPALEVIAQQVTWWVKALPQIGQNALLLALQARHVDQKDMAAFLQQFKDENEAVNFVTEYLTALLQAQEAAQQIVNLREDNKVLRAKLDLYEIERDEWRKKYEGLMGWYSYLLNRFVPDKQAKALLLGLTAMSSLDLAKMQTELPSSSPSSSPSPSEGQPQGGLK